MKEILLVDDEPGFLASLVEGLSETPDYSLRTANDGKAAVQILGSVPVDLVLTDLKMPGMGGFELVAYMARNHPQVPVLVMSAFATPEIEDNLRMLGVSGLVEKPIDIETLQSHIARSLAGGDRAEGEQRGRSALELLATLREVGVEQQDGEVVARHGQDYARIFFHQGKIAWVVSSAVRQTLMSLIVERGHVALEDVKVVFEECRKNNKNFGETLIEWGLIERDTLRAVMLEHFGRALVAALEWPGSKVLFIPETRAYSGTLLFDIEELVAEAERLEAPAPAAALPVEPAPEAPMVLDEIPPERPHAADASPGDEPVSVNAAESIRGGSTAPQQSIGENVMSELVTILDTLRNVEGFVGAACFTPAGEVLAEVSNTGSSLAELGALANDILLKSQKSTDIMGVGRGNMVHITAPRAQVLVRCLNENTDFAANEAGRAHVHTMLILDAEGNLGLGKMRLEKVLQQLAPHLR